MQQRGNHWKLTKNLWMNICFIVYSAYILLYLQLGASTLIKSYIFKTGVGFLVELLEKNGVFVQCFVEIVSQILL